MDTSSSPSDSSEDECSRSFVLPHNELNNNPYRDDPIGPASWRQPTQNYMTDSEEEVCKSDILLASDILNQ